jgi:hypothetical protein
MDLNSFCLELEKQLQNSPMIDIYKILLQADIPDIVLSVVHDIHGYAKHVFAFPVCEFKKNYSFQIPTVTRWFYSSIYVKLADKVFEVKAPFSTWDAFVYCSAIAHIVRNHKDISQIVLYDRFIGVKAESDTIYQLDFSKQVYGIGTRYNVSLAQSQYAEIYDYDAYAQIDGKSYVTLGIYFFVELSQKPIHDKYYYWKHAQFEPIDFSQLQDCDIYVCGLDSHLPPIVDKYIAESLRTNEEFKDSYVYGCIITYAKTFQIGKIWLAICKIQSSTTAKAGISLSNLEPATDITYSKLVDVASIRYLYFVAHKNEIAFTYSTDHQRRMVYDLLRYLLKHKTKPIEHFTLYAVSDTKIQIGNRYNHNTTIIADNKDAKRVVIANIPDKRVSVVKDIRYDKLIEGANNYCYVTPRYSIVCTKEVKFNTLLTSKDLEVAR